MNNQVQATRTENGRYTFTFDNITIRVHSRGGRGWSFVNAPPALLGVFPSLDAAKQAFARLMDKKVINDNPLVDDDVDREKGTILDPANRFGPPPVRRSTDTVDAVVRVEEKLGPLPKYGIWSISTENWVHENDNICRYPTKKAATDDIRAWAIENKDYEVRVI